MIRKGIAILLVAGSLALAVLIFSGSKSSLIAPAASKVSAQNNSDNQNELPKTESLSNSNTNSTKEMAKKIAQELAKNNSSQTTGATDQFKISAGKPDELINKALANQFNNLDVENLTPNIKIEDLKIAKTSDKQVAENYLKNFKAILKANLSNLNSDLSQPTVDDFQRLTSAYQKAIAGFYNLIVPENLSQIHREEIWLLTIQKNIFENLADYQTDPLKAYVSAQVFQEISRQSLALNKEIMKYITQNNLKI